MPRIFYILYTIKYLNERTHNIYMSHEERKIKRIEIIKRSIEKAKNPDFERLIAIGIVEWGCSRRTMLEYINSVLVYLKREVYKKRI